MAGGSSSAALASSAISITRSMGPEAGSLTAPGLGGIEEGAALPVGAALEVGLFAAAPFEGRGKAPWPFGAPLVLGAEEGEGADAAAKAEATAIPGGGVAAGGLESGWTPFVLVAGGDGVIGAGKGCEPSLRAPPTPEGGP